LSATISPPAQQHCSKAAALEKKSEAEKQKTESARQDKFKKDQQSLEKELGL
jgi:hypothetical protein